MDIQLVRVLHGFVPDNEAARELHKKLAPGEVIHGEFRKMRNVAFHRKFFALLKIGYDYWDPGEISGKYGKPGKNFERFRKDVTILAGHYHSAVRLDGTVRVEADSISFGSMDEETFQGLYSGVIDVFMKHIPTMKKMGLEEINKIVDRVLEFA